MVSTANSSITPELIREHGITPQEYEKIKQLLGGREPSLTELGIFSVMWSEHCSYKSRRVHLKRLPTRSKLVVQGREKMPASSTSATGGRALSRSSRTIIPVYIEPFQGAATGVGGILRDIFTMGARPVAVMDSLRFGPITARSRVNCGADRTRTTPSSRAWSAASRLRQLLRRSQPGRRDQV